MFALRRVSPNIIVPRMLSHAHFQKHTTFSNLSNFFRIIKEHAVEMNPVALLHFLQNAPQLKASLDKINNAAISDYLHQHFLFWLNAYALHQPSACLDYLSGKGKLDTLCSDFIQFCFENQISLDKDRTLNSFKKHNELSDHATKAELVCIEPKQELALLGFGLDDGAYEKTIAEHLVATGKAKQVKIYGFDPYAKKSDFVRYLSVEDLANNQFKFDLVLARWVLHHVELKHRWGDFISCINSCQDGAKVVIIEHGFLQEDDLLYKRLSNFLNATFDIVANIGIRPGYFLDSERIGANFYIHYLSLNDFATIRAGISVGHVDVKLYDVGPGFPNQTVCSMSLK